MVLFGFSLFFLVFGTIFFVVLGFFLFLFFFCHNIKEMRTMDSSKCERGLLNQSPHYLS